ncbi:MAG: hypothetical protein HUU35_12375 [Armatimonadetes bacterium]|nr:hypothetical protein [Armatimonadota bacterium]
MTELAVFLDVGEPAELTLTVHEADGIWDLEGLARPPLTTGTARATAGWTRFGVNLELAPQRFHWFRLQGPAGVAWRYAADDALGTVSSFVRPDGTLWFAPSTWARWKSMAIRLEPAPRPYSAQQAISGVARPERQVNAWISDPTQALPQWLEVRLPEPREVDTAQLLFDTQLNRINYVTPGLFRAPECVRDYLLKLEVAGQWRRVAEVSGNYQRRCEHRFEPLRATAARLTVLATNGDPSARVYALRLYREP